MVEKKTYVIGAILLVLLATGIVYISMGDQVKIRVDNDKTTFYLKNINADGEFYGRWLVTGREYVKLYDGSKLEYRDAKNIEINTVIDDTRITITRNTPYKSGARIIQTYEFDGAIDDVLLFPISHEIKCFNCEGNILQYEVRDLKNYNGETKGLLDVQNIQIDRMKIEWEEGNYYAKIFQQKSSDKVIVKYRPKSNYETYSIRLFDPIIPLSKAMVLFADKATLERDIFGYVNELDDNTTIVEAGKYIKLNFPVKLDYENDITIYAESESSTNIEVSTDKQVLGDFNITSFNKYRFDLETLSGIEDKFYLGINDEDLNIDYILDPPICPDSMIGNGTEANPCVITNCTQLQEIDTITNYSW